MNEELIRLHVVANSDSEKDQYIKLQVRNAVIAAVQEDLEKIGNVEEAKNYLKENLQKIQKTADETLRLEGTDENAMVQLCKEAFDTRIYDTFTLPAGVYESLRITIGKGQGKNWWCVTFPSLCLPATTEGFGEKAVEAGLSESLSNALSGEEGYEIRFYLLDVLGRMENTFYEWRNSH